ncbi:putative oxidoreductase [Alteromonadaceae bacterium Bs31]|nr:putative oxidoreductase [Alteromonadaceae bacterium Bs31]
MQQLIQTYSAPIGRVLLALIFVTSGLSKIAEYGATAGWMESMGVPGALLPLVILLEVLGGLAVMLGWQTRIAAFLLAGFTLLSALLFHSDFSSQAEMTNFMKNFSIAGGFLILLATGPGPFALDTRKNTSAN